MSIFVIGGTGFIGIRVIPSLVARGETVVCMDINPNAPSFAGLGDKVTVVRGDVTQFDDVIGNMEASKADRVINLSYNLGQDLPPHRATKLNIIGMDNCFEAARILGVKHTVFASSLAVNGQQSHYGERAVTEDDYKHAVVQYGSHKAFNEFQAKDYIDKHGMTITAVRPANVTGPDKVRGSVDHVNIITRPARGEAISFPFADAMRCPIHVDDIAEVFIRVLMTDKPAHAVYSSGGQAISLADIAVIVREFLPDAKISFEKQSGGRASSGNWMIDNSRLVQEFGVQYRSYRERVLQIINEVRAELGQAPIKG
ncbi:MAG: NAD(P)-dependent oxidoreductase [Acetobacteraceae bacterium]|nr:NAD(P)-dependent oxidoreductase [Acetobacteraceae bacterium]